MKVYNNLDRIPAALEKARARVKRSSAAGQVKKTLTKMRGDLRSSSPNPRRWEHAQGVALTGGLRPHEWGCDLSVLLGCIVVVGVIAWYVRKNDIKR